MKLWRSEALPYNLRHIFTEVELDLKSSNLDDLKIYMVGHKQCVAYVNYTKPMVLKQTMISVLKVSSSMIQVFQGPNCTFVQNAHANDNALFGFFTNKQVHSLLKI